MSISIHLMLLFNRLERYGFRQQFYFNTSNVTIQQQSWQLMCIRVEYFNTSNVTIQRCAAISLTFLQYHFNTSNVTIQPYLLLYSSIIIFISIHLMLLFNRITKHTGLIKCTISIHLMLLFNQFISFVGNVSCSISIHLMLLFNLTHTPREV